MHIRKPLAPKTKKVWVCLFMCEYSPYVYITAYAFWQHHTGDLKNSRNAAHSFASSLLYDV